MVEVRVDAIEKRFGSTQVLRGIDIHVPDGAFAVLVGPSGCGKSTLLRLLAGLEEATAGSIRFGARDVTQLEPRARDVAMVFQSYALYPHLTVRQNLGFGLKIRGTDKATIRARVDEVAGMLGLEALLDRYPRALSGGQRQRVAMGRAIVRRPALFLFDEPLSNLDAKLRAQVRVEIRRQHDQLSATSIYVTHDQVEAMTLADVMFVLNAGKVEQYGSPAEVYGRPATRFVAGFLGSPAMNFIEATVERAGARAYATTTTAATGAEGDAATLRVAIPEGQFKHRFQDGERVTVGIRPHDVALARGDGAPELEFTSGLVELLGPELQAHGQLGETPVTVCLATDSQARRGQRLRLRVEHLHLFDPDTGASLR